MILNPTIQQLIVHVYTKFRILALKIPEKTPTQILMLTCNIGKERKMIIYRKIRAMTLSLNPTI